MAMECAWQPSCIRYGFATRLTLKHYLGAAQPGRLRLHLRARSGLRERRMIFCRQLTEATARLAAAGVLLCRRGPTIDRGSRGYPS